MGEVVDLVVALRKAVLARYPEVDLGRPGAVDALARQADQAYADLEDERVLPGRAVVLRWRTSMPWLEDAQRGRVEIRLGDDEALAWCATQLRDMVPELDPSFELVVDPAHEALLPHLAGSGLATRMCLLHGSPQRALAGLRRGGLPPEALEGLSLEPFDEERHLEGIVVLLREVFAERPELGMLPPGLIVTQAMQRRLDDFTRQNLRTCGAKGAVVVMQGDELVGQASVHMRDDPLVGRAGGIGIGLRPAIRGRGVGKALYEQLLERMIEGEVDLMRGRTANPAVRHLAERMGRQVRGWQLELAMDSGAEA